MAVSNTPAEKLVLPSRLGLNVTDISINKYAGFGNNLIRPLPGIFRQTVVVQSGVASQSLDNDAETIVDGLNRIAERLDRPVAVSKNALQVLAVLSELHQILIDPCFVPANVHDDNASTSWKTVKASIQKIIGHNNYTNIKSFLESHYYDIYIALVKLITPPNPGLTSPIAQIVYMRQLRNDLLWLEFKVVQSVAGDDISV